MNKEFKRMMKLAGLNEIKINKPGTFKKLNLPFNSTNSNTPIPVDELDNNFAELTEDLIRLNPQIAVFFPNQNNNFLDGIYDSVLDTLETDYSNGATLKEFYKIYFDWLWAHLVADYSKYSGAEVDARDEQYSHMREEFADYAINGKWLAVAGVTA
jgi:hypothetical protein